MKIDLGVTRERKLRDARVVHRHTPRKLGIGEPARKFPLAEIVPPSSGRPMP